MSNICPTLHNTQGSKGGVEHKVKDGHGLMMRHAYSMIDVGEIWEGKSTGMKKKQGQKTTKLVRLRNPWGFGEWTGPFGDDSDEFKNWKKELDAEFSGPIRRPCKGHNVKGHVHVESEDVESADAGKDGAFFMPWEDWKRLFTVVFAGVDFPQEYFGLRVVGNWDAKKRTCGGSCMHSTWRLNPTYRHVTFKHFSWCGFPTRIKIDV